MKNFKQDAKWWREYREKKRERLREYNTRLKREHRARNKPNPVIADIGIKVNGSIQPVEVSESLDSIRERLRAETENIMAGGKSIIEPEQTGVKCSQPNCKSWDAKEYDHHDYDRGDVKILLCQGHAIQFKKT